MSTDDNFAILSDGDDANDESSSILNSMNISLDQNTRKKQLPRSNTCRRALQAVSIYAILLCVSIWIYESLRRQSVPPDRTVHLLPGREVMPLFEHSTIIQFARNQSFTGPGSSQAWKNLAPRGGGWIAVEHGDRLGLGPPLRFYNGVEGYGVSVFHQIHCMAALHEVYLRLSAGGEAQELSHDPDHVEHCFDYVRQAIMCHADLSLEHRQDGTDSVPNDDMIDGWGVLHQCRDWNALVEFVEESRRTAKM